MTSRAMLAVLLASSAVTLATITGWIVCGLGSFALGPARHLAAPVRARLLAQVRLIPLMMTAALVPVQILAFTRFEAGGAESAGPLLMATACAGMVLIVDAVIAGMSAWRRTHTVVAAWRRSSTPLRLSQWTRRAWTIHRPFPVVAVVGVVGPELYVARQVARDCTSEELAAIVAHEAAHANARDNLMRVLYRITPGARLLSPIAEPLEREWMVAAEEAADLSARRATSGLELASALTKVARLASGCPPEVMPASALIGEGNLECRVRRLLEPPIEGGQGRRVIWIPAGLLIVGAILVVSTPALASLHELFELLVRR